MRLFSLIFAVVSLSVSADSIGTKLYCIQQNNPTSNKSIFIQITEYKGSPSSQVGDFELENGGLGPNDYIVCPYIRVSSGTTAVISNGAVTGYASDDFKIVFDAPLTAGNSVSAHLWNSQMFQANNLPMTCTLSDQFPYQCDPHPFHGE